MFNIKYFIECMSEKDKKELLVRIEKRINKGCKNMFELYVYDILRGLK